MWWAVTRDGGQRYSIHWDRDTPPPPPPPPTAPRLLRQDKKMLLELRFTATLPSRRHEKSNPLQTLNNAILFNNRIKLLTPKRENYSDNAYQMRGPTIKHKQVRCILEWARLHNITEFCWKGRTYFHNRNQMIYKYWPLCFGIQIQKSYFPNSFHCDLLNSVRGPQPMFISQFNKSLFQKQFISGETEHFRNNIHRRVIYMSEYLDVPKLR